ncbi:MAG: pseudouridine synthase [Bacteroidales bacterium]|nr:pseudouridine synthase [Bacteroidales bacterium]
MSTENENWGNTSSENENTNQGGYRTFNREKRSFSSGYGDRRPGSRPRQRINNNRAYSSNGSQNRAFRPSSFNTESGEEQREYRPRYNSEGGFRPQGFGGQQRQGGYQQRSNSYNREGGYQPRQNNGYSRPQQGGYNREGGYQQRDGGYQRQGGFQRQNNGYGRPQQGGFQRGGYQQRPRTADYNPNAKYSRKKQLEYHAALLDPDAPIRLNKYLANAGICSRREADEFIAAGVISVNGEIVTELGSKVNPATDIVKFHDQSVKLEHKVYVLLNKPKGYVTTTDDPQERKTVMELVKNACKERIFPVGRLDRQTTGVLLFTNDGDLTAKLTHPKFLKKKIYHVHLDKNVAHSDLEQIAAGITLEDGEIHADAVSYASETDKSQVGIEIHSGRNRIVRRIFEHLGYKVVKLDRVLFAGLTKKNLRRGEWRFLTEAEVNMLRMGAFE